MDENKLKFEDVAEIGDTIHAHDFPPRAGMPECWVEGRVISKGTNESLGRFKAFTISCTKAVFNGTQDDSRIGKEIVIPMEVAFMEFDGRVVKVESLYAPIAPNHGRDVDFQRIYNEADVAGLKAGNDHAPTPMIVERHSNALDDSSPVVETFPPVMDGVCGFAWVIVRPTRSPFGSWLRKSKLGDYSEYERGVSIWCGYFNQSMERKERWAEAFAGVLRANGINASAHSRID